MPESKEGASPMLLLEWWKPVVGWDSYEISNVGRVRKVGKTESLGGFISRKGYRMVQLHHHGHRKTLSVHGLMAAVFIGPRPNGLVVNHKCGWKLRNWASNLEYVSSLENTQHAIRLGLYKPGTYSVRLSNDDVLEIRRLLAAGRFTTDIARVFGVDNSSISRIQNGKIFANVGLVADPLPNRGERHPQATLSEADVVAIRGLKGIRKLREVAAEYGISTTQVSDIQNRRAWKHVL